jgi:Ribbon-helix-helix protein, copG family
MTEELFKNLHLQLSAEDIRRIDEWKISRGMKSRTEAIRAMIRIATNSFGEETVMTSKTMMAESNNSKFVRPEGLLKEKIKNESVEELIRKIIKEELAKIIG